VESRNTALRTVDVARRAGCSVQHVRNLEQAGALPPTTRTPAGYRTYTHVHVLAAAAYVTLSAGVGPVQAKTILRTAHRSPLPELLDALDAAHAGLHNERRVVHRQHALTAISAEPIHAPRADDAMTISELAGALGVRASALRHWEHEGLLTPTRSTTGRARTYSPVDVRDARVIHQLRLAGHRVPALRQLLAALRGTGQHGDITAALSARQDNITQRSRALLRAAAVLESLITATRASDQGAAPDDGRQSR
jgi:DNA-binding transcriptional MerR regulator